MTIDKGHISQRRQLITTQRRKHEWFAANYRWKRVYHANVTENENSIDDTVDLDGGDGRNKELNKQLPYMRYGHTVVEYKGKAYLWGGRNDEYGASSQLHEFDPSMLNFTFHLKENYTFCICKTFSVYFHDFREYFSNYFYLVRQYNSALERVSIQSEVGFIFHQLYEGERKRLVSDWSAPFPVRILLACSNIESRQFIYSFNKLMNTPIFRHSFVAPGASSESFPSR